VLKSLNTGDIGGLTWREGLVGALGLADPFQVVVGHNQVAVVHSLRGLLGEVHIHHSTVVVGRNCLAEGHNHLGEGRTHEEVLQEGVVRLEAHLLDLLSQLLGLACNIAHNIVDIASTTHSIVEWLEDLRQPHHHFLHCYHILGNLQAHWTHHPNPSWDPLDGPQPSSPRTFGIFAHMHGPLRLPC